MIVKIINAKSKSELSIAHGRYFYNYWVDDFVMSGFTQCRKIKEEECDDTEKEGSDPVSPDEFVICVEIAVLI